MMYNLYNNENYTTDFKECNPFDESILKKPKFDNLALKMKLLVKVAYKEKLIYKKAKLCLKCNM